jgi:hypothetical protein
MEAPRAVDIAPNRLANVAEQRLHWRESRMSGAALLSGLFQLAYVTNNLEAAAARFRDQYGTGEFLFMRDLPGPIALALAYAGDTMIELIEPGPGGPPLYSDWIAGMEGVALRHHHCGFLIDGDSEWTAVRSRFVEQGNVIPMEGQMPGALDYLYADTTADLGHYLEYIRLYEGGRQLFASVPGSPFAKAHHDTQRGSSQ